MKWLAGRYLRLRGWRFTGGLPDVPRMVLAGAPHTSNWDFVIFLAALDHYRVSMSFVGKHTLFKWPFGWFLRRWGGIPTNKKLAGGLVRQVVDAMLDSDTMILALAPEGTRFAVPHWKGGFLQIARGAGVPIVLAYIDSTTRTAGIGPVIHDLSDTRQIMDQARAFYADKQGYIPERKGPVRLRDE